MKKQEVVYSNEDQSAIINLNNQFVYEVFVYLTFENVFMMVNHQLYASDKEIKNIIEVKKINKFIEIHCYLYSAPKNWLEENNFSLYINPKKIKNG